MSRVFYISPGKTVTIDGLTVTNGNVAGATMAAASTTISANADGDQQHLQRQLRRRLRRRHLQLRSAR